MSNRTFPQDNIAIGLSLQEAREAMGVTQQKIADTVGLTKNHISKIERGQCKASISVLIGYIAACDITPNDILGFVDSGAYIIPELKKTLKTLTDDEQRKLNKLIRLYKS